jgi:hypothetical protein
MQKQNSKFKETRQEAFHRLYPSHYADMRSKVMNGGQWGSNDGRKRVRALARLETRLHVKQLRKTNHERNVHP